MKNTLKIKVIAKRMMDEDSVARSFSFPLRTEETYAEFENCFSKKLYTEKLVNYTF